MPNGQEKSENQEKSGKTKKKDKSQVKMKVLEKKVEKFFFKHQFFQLNFTKFFILKSR